MKKNALPLLALLLCLLLAACGGQTPQETPTPSKPSDPPETKTTVVTGEAEGYGGAIIAEVTLSDGKIVDLKLTGDGETPAIGGAALEPLRDNIIAAGTVEGVDGVSGATWTSNGVFSAVRKAMGIEVEEPSGSDSKELSATGLSHGLGVAPSGRIGPGKDDQDVQVYSFNEVIAYVLFDDDGRILDLEIDQLEVATPNYDGEHMPDFTGFPGQSYNADENHDEKVDAVWTQDNDTFLAQVDAFTTKRDRGSNYKLNSGSWEQEMDIYEEAFRGMTVDEIEAWFASSFSDLNGRPLSESATKDEDIAKWNKMTDGQKAEMDAISGATISLKDGHGDIIAAIRKAYENRRSVEVDSVSKIGLGISNTGRIGPGKDDQDVQVYSFNTPIVGACFDSDGRIVAMYSDMMEVATPNYDGEHMPHLTGFPGQSYNADENHDEKADGVWEQDDDTFLAQVESWLTKRERGDTYKLNSGTWAGEMDIFEAFFKGKTSAEIAKWYAESCSDLNGRPLNGSSQKDEDIAKRDKLTDDQKAELDAITGATMSLNDAHGNILESINRAWTNAKDTSITIGK